MRMMKKKNPFNKLIGTVPVLRIIIITLVSSANSGILLSKKHLNPGRSRLQHSKLGKQYNGTTRIR